MFISSDPHALTTHTQRVVFMEDGDIATLTSDSISMSPLNGINKEANITVLKMNGAKRN